MTINARDKGKRFELKIAAVWMRLFGGEVERTGYVNKKLDDQGVDLTNTPPFNIQCKAHERSLDMHAILERMPINENYNIVIHKKNHRPPVVAMHLEDFLEIIEMLKRNQVL